METKYLCLIVTSHDALGETGHNTGFWYEELAAPYYVFKDAGFTPIIVTPKGGRPPLDPGSAAPEFRSPSVERFETDPEAQAALEQAVTPENAPNGPAALFLVGGHGTMWDFADWTSLGAMLQSADAARAPIGAVCHGVAGLLSYRDGETHPLVTGRQLTGFSSAEEAAVGLTEVVPFLLEDRLTEAGGTVRTGAVFSETVVTDGLLVTGQNPASSHKAAEALLSLLLPAPAPGV